MTVSLAVILYLIAKTLPRVDDKEISATPIIKDQWITGYLEKIDEWIKIFMEKTLRRAKVLILKLDNIVTKKINHFKKEPAKETKLPFE